jgi:hypothetical protein
MLVALLLAQCAVAVVAHHERVTWLPGCRGGGAVAASGASGVIPVAVQATGSSS